MTWPTRCRLGGDASLIAVGRRSCMCGVVSAEMRQQGRLWSRVVLSTIRVLRMQLPDLSCGRSAPRREIAGPSRAFDKTAPECGRPGSCGARARKPPLVALSVGVDGRRPDVGEHPRQVPVPSVGLLSATDWCLSALVFGRNTTYYRHVSQPRPP